MRYIPSSLNDFIGNQENTNLLRNYAQDKKYGNSFVISGPVNSGKTVLANIFAKELCAYNSNLSIEYYSALDDTIDLSSILKSCANDCAVVVLDDFDLFSNQQQHVIAKRIKDNFLVILCATDYSCVPLYLQDSYIPIFCTYLEDQELFDFLYDYVKSNDIEMIDEDLNQIVFESNGNLSTGLMYVKKYIELGQQSLFNLIRGTHYELCNSIFSNLDNSIELSRFVDDLLSYINPTSAYRLLADFSVKSYVSYNFNPLLLKRYGKKLLAYAKELYNLSGKSNTKSELLCDLLLLDNSIHSNKLYREVTDKVILDSTTNSRIQMQRSLIRNTKRSNVKEYDALSLAMRLGGQCRKQSG